MLETKVVNIRRDQFDVKIDRTSVFGNPYKIDLQRGMDRDYVIHLYKVYFLDRIAKDRKFKEMVVSLRGKRLGCWCSPLPCHGDVIVEWLDG